MNVILSHVHLELDGVLGREGRQRGISDLVGTRGSGGSKESHVAVGMLELDSRNGSEEHNESDSVFHC